MKKKMSLEFEKEMINGADIYINGAFVVPLKSWCTH